MWISPMLTIWLYMAIGGLIIQALILWKFYGSDPENNENNS